MHFKWFLVAFAFLAVQVTISQASSKRGKKKDDEPKENSISYGLFSGDSVSSKFYSTMLHDATLPVFLVMGIASVVSALSHKNESEGIHGRGKREVTSNRWSQNILKVLANVQIAIEKYQHLEGEIINDLDEGLQREFTGKESL
ncbi:hypothetical protein HDE_00831 [Halotydeus destructor]|nr:hypothetical protein HDE_00831 [Halotydeus destructor]